MKFNHSLFLFFPPFSQLLDMSKKKGNNNSDNKDDEYVAISEYLKRVNRPYSATDIFNNLQGKYSKSIITKTLDLLVENSVVISKTYGKSVIYSVKQDLQNKEMESDMKSLEKKIDMLSKEYEDIVSQNKKLEHEISVLKTQPNSDEARIQLDTYIKENQQMEQRLKTLRGEAKLIPVEKRKRVEKEFEYSKKMWKKRKAMFNDIYHAVTEHMPGDPKQLKHDLGIEEDTMTIDKVIML
ncbi:Tat binding protein 1-interacting protein-domain-containing protein [Pilobolus umbonatus]|nr:Tat binding protein 1-interacting protein-domain-containing protein [Pilobolus umbonatus]